MFCDPDTRRIRGIKTLDNVLEETEEDLNVSYGWSKISGIDPFRVDSCDSVVAAFSLLSRGFDTLDCVCSFVWTLGNKLVECFSKFPATFKGCQVGFVCRCKADCWRHKTRRGGMCEIYYNHSAASRQLRQYRTWGMGTKPSPLAPIGGQKSLSLIITCLSFKAQSPPCNFHQ